MLALHRVYSPTGVAHPDCYIHLKDGNGHRHAHDLSHTGGIERGCASRGTLPGEEVDRCVLLLDGQGKGSDEEPERALIWIYVSEFCT